MYTDTERVSCTLNNNGVQLDTETPIVYSSGAHRNRIRNKRQCINMPQTPTDG